MQPFLNGHHLLFLSVDTRHLAPFFARAGSIELFSGVFRGAIRPPALVTAFVAACVHRPLVLVGAAGDFVGMNGYGDDVGEYFSRFRELS